MHSIKAKEVSTLDEIITHVEELVQSNKGYVFRGQPDSKFSLMPVAFRKEGMYKLSAHFPAPWQEWFSPNELLELVSHGMRSITPSVSKLTLYIMQYNYSLALYVAQNKQKFDPATQTLYEIRNANFWCEKRAFLDLFHRFHMSLMGIENLQGRILKHSTIDEGLTGYDETLSQHYGVPTAALDWTHNPYKAIHFAIQNTAAAVTHVSLYAFREIIKSEENPVLLIEGNPDCQNDRQKAQEGLFTYIRPGIALLNYITSDLVYGNGIWVSIENCIPRHLDKMEVLKFNIPKRLCEDLNNLLMQKGITKSSLLLDS